MGQSRESIGGVVVVPEKAEDFLNERQLLDYREFRSDLINWLLNLGKDPEKADGYAGETARHRAYKIDRFYRWVWREEMDGYSLEVSEEHADEYLSHLAYQDYTTSYKAGCLKSLKTLFRYRAWKRDEEYSWEPRIKFSQNPSLDQPRDFLTRDERRKIREASLNYKSIPSYHSVTPGERDKWKIYLAQRLEKPKAKVSKQDWEKANSWKIPSMVWTSMDAGLRPIEVARARTNWLDLDNSVLRIPKEEASKNNAHATRSLRDRTANILRKWLEEREMRSRYEGTDKVWLTRHGNPYGSGPLSNLLDKLCEGAEIPVENRKMTWYTIRHSVGTYMAREEGLAAAQAQLRHKSEKTTMKYDQAPLEDRKEALQRMG